MKGHFLCVFLMEAVATSGGPAFSQGDKLIVMVTWWGIPKTLLNGKNPTDWL